MPGRGPQSSDVAVFLFHLKGAAPIDADPGFSDFRIFQTLLIFRIYAGCGGGKEFAIDWKSLRNVSHVIFVMLMICVILVSFSVV